YTTLFRSIVHSTPRTEHQHRYLPASRPQGLDQGQAIQAGQHSVHNQQVIVFAGGHIQAIMPVGGAINLIAALFQAVFEVLCDLVIIFDNENPHAFTPLVVTEQSVAQLLQATAVSMAESYRARPLSRNALNHPRPDSVSPAGRYSQLTQP